jgi:hypothetical protein
MGLPVRIRDRRNSTDPKQEDSEMPVISFPVVQIIPNCEAITCYRQKALEHFLLGVGLPKLGIQCGRYAYGFGVKIIFCPSVSDLLDFEAGTPKLVRVYGICLFGEIKESPSKSENRQARIIADLNMRILLNAN